MILKRLVNTILNPIIDKIAMTLSKPIVYLDYLTDCKGCKWNNLDSSNTERCKICTCGDFYERGNYDDNNSYRNDMFNANYFKLYRQKIKRRI